MLNILHVVAQHSGMRSHFTDAEEMNSVYEHVRALNGWAFSLKGSPAGIAIEVPFGDNSTALIELLTEVPHPQLGNGLLVLSRIRPAQRCDLESVLSLIEKLNCESLIEQSVFPSIGAWSAWELEGKWAPAFSTFIPNLIAAQGVARDTAAVAMARLQILNRYLHPQHTDQRAIDIIARRLSADVGAVPPDPLRWPPIS
jgi:hypothetical protein